MKNNNTADETMRRACAELQKAIDAMRRVSRPNYSRYIIDYKHNRIVEKERR